MADLFGAVDVERPFSLPQGAGVTALWNPSWRGYDITLPDGELFYAEQFFAPKISNRMVEYLQDNDRVDWHHRNWRDVSPEELDRIKFENIEWKQDWIKFYGRRSPLPRLTAWYGDEGKSYTYSGIKSEPSPWNKGLLYVKDAIEACAGVTFNSVLLNWYRDGGDHLGWHADDEKELGSNPTIASANFGATRDFLMRRKDDPSQKATFQLKHGTLLLMKGRLQQFWEHSVPKRKGVGQSRFNMTFRRIGLDG